MHVQLYVQKMNVCFLSNYIYVIFGIPASLFRPDFIDVHDLQEVLSEIKSVSQVQNLGLALGLLVTAVDEIRKDFTSVKEQKIQVIKCWLKRTDIIRKMQSCPPTWSQLADAVAEDDVALSKSIRQKYCTTLQ